MEIDRVTGGDDHETDVELVVGGRVRGIGGRGG